MKKVPGGMSISGSNPTRSTFNQAGRNVANSGVTRPGVRKPFGGRDSSNSKREFGSKATSKTRVGVPKARIPPTSHDFLLNEEEAK